GWRRYSEDRLFWRPRRRLRSLLRGLSESPCTLLALLVSPLNSPTQLDVPLSSGAQTLDAASGGTSPSRLYSYSAFFDSLRSFSVSGIRGDAYHLESNPYVPNLDRADDRHADDPANEAFFLGQDDPDDPKSAIYGIVNVCAFLANAMAESVQFDACEELNGIPYGGLGGRNDDGDGGLNRGEEGRILLRELGGAHGRYFPMSNACGQFGKDHRDEGPCPLIDVDGDEVADDDGVPIDARCPADPTMRVTAEPHPRYNSKEGTDDVAAGDRPPPPFFCAPKGFDGDYAGYWDGYDAAFVRRVAHPSVLGNVDVEGCCFWGRGALMTRGTCDLGRVDHLMGRRAYDAGRPSRFPEVDFCENPSVVCGQSTAELGGAGYGSLKFDVALADWIVRVQGHARHGREPDDDDDDDEEGWDYLSELRSLVDGGLEGDATSKFIDEVSSAVTRGCAGRRCSRRTIPYFDERRKYFETLVYDVFGLAGDDPPTLAPPAYDFEHVERWLNARRSVIEGNVFVSRDPAVLDDVPYFSREFPFEPFAKALRQAAHFGLGDRRYFFVGDVREGLRGFNAGLVNLAFFLANIMAESVTVDSCDEVHWDRVGVKFPLANSCGVTKWQGLRQRDVVSEVPDNMCKVVFIKPFSTPFSPEWQSFMTCDVPTEASMEADATKIATPPFLQGAQPPRFHCRPGTDPAGYYDGATQTIYAEAAVENAHGRGDVDGCCLWGRGALHTRGSCNYGKVRSERTFKFDLTKKSSVLIWPNRFLPRHQLNFHLGAQAAADDRPSLYPNVDFCTDLGAICDDETMEMRFVVAMFEWIDRVQDYYQSVQRWSYLDELYNFLDEGMDNDVFIDAVSGIVAQGCHARPCTSAIAVETNRVLYGLERKMHFKNIVKLVFELPIGASSDSQPVGVDPWAEVNGISSAGEIQPYTPPTFRPTPRPTPLPTSSESRPTAQDPIAPTVTTTTSPPTVASLPTSPTRSPVEYSDVTVLNDGRTHVIDNDASSLLDESIILTRNTTLSIEKGGYIQAPFNTDWPAIRASIASTVVGKGGYVNGSYADPAFLEGDCENGGDAIHINNGQNGPETASKARFHSGVHVIGGDAPEGLGGDALRVNGFATEVFIEGGHFAGGTGTRGDGLSLYVLNSAKVHIRSGTFTGEMKVERRGAVIFYGCFSKDGTRVTGLFSDDTELDVTVRTFYGGEVILVPVSEQICETAPSTAPTNFPTVSHQPTVPQNRGFERNNHFVFIFQAVFSVILLLAVSW
ncbi:hypothetical protein ACHAWF_015324, partial [Thalassiosira exigua]